MPKLAALDILSSFYLAGGTAAALQLGHRESVDLDFFSEQDFIPEKLLEGLNNLGEMQITHASSGTLHVLLKSVRLTFLRYPYPLIAPLVSYQGLQIANLRDIALMKVTAIANRGAKKDFIDLYAIATRVWPLVAILDSLPDKFSVRYSLGHILRSLVYFEDAEREPMPKMHDWTITWPSVKEFFRKEVCSYLQQFQSREG